MTEEATNDRGRIPGNRRSQLSRLCSDLLQALTETAVESQQTLISASALPQRWFVGTCREKWRKNNYQDEMRT